MPRTSLQINIESSKAQLLLHFKYPKLQISRERGGLEMESHPIQVDIDNREFYDSMGLKSIRALADDLITKGKKAVRESTTQYVREGNMMAAPNGKDAISQIAVMRTQKSIESVLAFIPQSPPKLYWTGGWVDITHTPDKLQYHWDTGGVEKTYIPYSVDFSVVEKSGR